MSQRLGSSVPANAPVLTAQWGAGGLGTVMDPTWVAFFQGLAARSGRVGDLVETLPDVKEREGCIRCDGGTYRQSEYPDLFTLLGPLSAAPGGLFSVPAITRTGRSGEIEAAVWVRAR